MRWLLERYQQAYVYREIRHLLRATCARAMAQGYWPRRHPRLDNRSPNQVGYCKQKVSRV